ncbi:MAG: hypothetical protein FJY80_09615 [Candidatus Aminicenantes bacterium]|nr:hypothetical protein [Candidatus Aminicenantes bacterium]
MKEEQRLERRRQTLVWGLLLIWWGYAALADFLPHGAIWVGSGFILLGINVVRAWTSGRLNGFSTGLGLAAFCLGTAALAGDSSARPAVLVGSAIALQTLGVLMLAANFRRTRDERARTS